ncbi:MAG: TIGR03960 family B12-binding radical SAM protein [Clostridiales Family XIII bacterium]|nr:TIGR03960 family B12-binding radical SAM protein [Clostridiales Family XIII bacterium]
MNKNHAAGVPIRSYLTQVERPGRYIGNEINAIQKDFAEVDVRFCLAFPDLYEIGMSYTGLQILYGLLNQIPYVFCERAFAPAEDMETLLRTKNLPLFTIDTHTDIKAMDFLGFTLQYEHSYTNILNMIELAGIPLLSAERAKEETYPLLIAGGPCCYNPEPLADVFDLFLIGDAEDSLPLLMEIYRNRSIKSGAALTIEEREAFLREATKLPGIYVPSFYTPVYEAGAFHHFEKKYDDLPDSIEKAVVRDLDAAFYPEKPIVPLIETVHGRAVAEIFRGCGRGCRFCQAGFVYRPVRRRSKDRILEIIETQLQNTGYDEVSLLSLSTGDYPDIEALVLELMERLPREDVSLSLPSLRLDSLSESVLRRIGEYKKSGLTFAPEAGTQRLRDVIHKNITEEHIFRGVENAVAIGWTRVKFYFMIGMPTETQEDIDGIFDLAQRVSAHIATVLRETREKGKRNFHLTVSVSNFVPKPNTPFQWARGNTEEELKEKNFYLKDKFRALKNVQFQFHDTRSSFVEMMLARGDRRTLDALRAAVRRGCKFDSWREYFHYDRWLEAFEEAGISVHTEPYPDPSAPLPWDIINDGTEKDFLRKQWAMATECEI